uniref:Uncharacterized protein n=1 Tax=Bosea sp. NBC_00436 TaxID=2969620 RepID=A0A9E7ZYA0_9HYPH
MARIIRLDSDFPDLADAQAVEKDVGAAAKAGDFAVEDHLDVDGIALPPAEPVAEPEKRSEHHQRR